MKKKEMREKRTDEDVKVEARKGEEVRVRERKKEGGPSMAQTFWLVFAG